MGDFRFNEVYESHWEGGGKTGKEKSRLTDRRLTVEDSKRKIFKISLRFRETEIPSGFQGSLIMET